jgi:hypothetical protein
MVAGRDRLHVAVRVRQRDSELVSGAAHKLTGVAINFWT